MPLSVGPTLSAFAVEVWLCASSCEASSKLSVQSPEIHLVLIVVRRVPRYRCFPKVEQMKNAQFLRGDTTFVASKLCRIAVCSQAEAGSQIGRKKRDSPKYSRGMFAADWQI